MVKDLHIYVDYNGHPDLGGEQCIYDSQTFKKIDPIELTTGYMIVATYKQLDYIVLVLRKVDLARSYCRS